MKTCDLFAVISKHLSANFQVTSTKKIYIVFDILTYFTSNFN